ncbi:hypothetical protein V6N13_096106 [Hibiscus sabdariffa]|uniref:Uncharacterized protein n=2 Tax=Hibiscus sabdariffa TaxID=183260 RepID=A0ABR1ZU06_9ROSI
MVGGVPPGVQLLATKSGVGILELASSSRLRFIWTAIGWALGFFLRLVVSTKECPNYDVNVCVNVLGLGGILIGTRCCSLLSTLVTADAQVCLCAIVKANFLGIVAVDATAELNLLLSQCSIYPTKTYSC